jgi:uncharacterized protein (TIGR02271 family)
MRQTVVGVFDRYEQARQAAAQLQDSGFGPEAVHVTESTFGDADEAGDERRGSAGMMDSIRSFFAEVFGAGDREDVSAYAEAVRRGGAVVKVDVDEDEKVDLARDTLQSAGAVDIEERAAEWRQEGWSPGSDTTAGDRAWTGASTDTLSGQAGTTAAREGEEVIPVVKEQLEVGKRTVGTGGVRVYARTVEEPVQESLQLREEHARVERRPVDRPASEADLDAFRDRTVEVRETAERPVVQKTARVVEEVVVGKEATERTQTVGDTLRSTEVDVERTGDPVDAGARGMSTGMGSGDTGSLGSGAQDFERYSDDFQSDYRSRYAALGGSYDEYLPAYRYGHSLTADERYRGRPWEEIEPSLRSDWEQRYPGSAWERFKDAVRHAWQRVST